MADQKEYLDRNEPATAYKLEKAHQNGSIVRSADLGFSVVLLACVISVHGLGSQMVEGMAQVMRHGLWFVSRNELSRASALAYAEALGGQTLAVIAPFAFSVWLSAVLIGALQARGVFTAKPLTPDFSRLNPAAGFKRIVSVKSLHDLFRNALKLILYSLAMWAWGRHQLGELLHLSTLQPKALSQAVMALTGSALTLLTGLMLMFALLEWCVNRWDFTRQMRMSKREIADEHKEREGNPRIKARLRELRLEWLRRARQISQVRNADVLLTNPSHYAVALRYRHGEMPAPMIIARGAGDLAQRMRAEARRRNVPMVPHPPLTRALFALRESESYVPEAHFESVARILRWVYSARGARRADAFASTGRASP